MKLLIYYWRSCWQRRLVCIFAGLFLLGSLCWMVLNWYGARQLQRVEAMLRADGETLDYHELMTTRVPDDENYCAIPILREVAMGFCNDLNEAPGMNPPRLEAFRLPDRPDAGPWLFFENASTGIPLDLRPWVREVRAEGSIVFPVESGDAAGDLMAAFSRHDPLILELAEGLDRPHAQWIIQGSATSPMSSTLESCALHHMIKSLRLHAIAAAQSTNATVAHTLALILLRLDEACISEAMFISQKSHCVPWEICNKHLGSHDDFVRLEGALANLDERRYLLMLIRSELARTVSLLQVSKIDRSKVGNSYSISTNLFALELFPDGIFDRHCARMGEHKFHYYIKPLKNGWRDALQHMEKLENRWANAGWLADEIMQRFSNKHSERLRRIFSQRLVFRMSEQACLDQAVIGCALERYRITHGDYPDLLDAVKRADGTALPLDIISGKPLNYRKTGLNAYRLWSVGEDGTDDGGKNDDALWVILGNS